MEPGGPAQLEHTAAEAEQPGLSGAGIGGSGLGGGVQVATMQPQVVTQLSAEESR